MWGEKRVQILLLNRGIVVRAPENKGKRLEAAIITALTVREPGAS